MIREKLLPYPKLAHNTGFFHLQEFFEEILSIPASTEALDKYVAEKVKEAGKFDMWKTNPYTKVLETSIEQLTQQRDLAVEALIGIENFAVQPWAGMATEALLSIKESDWK